MRAFWLGDFYFLLLLGFFGLPFCFLGVGVFSFLVFFFFHFRRNLFILPFIENVFHQRSVQNGETWLSLTGSHGTTVSSTICFC